MASKNQISQWAQHQQSNDTQKQLKAKLKLEGANMLRDIYEAILHIKDYCEKLKDSINIARTGKDNQDKDLKIVLREDCKPLNYFCQCVERVLLFGYKKKFFRSSSIWSFLCDSTSKCFPICEQLATDINLIKSIEVLNEDGKTRAFLRQSLRSKLIPLYFKLILQQHEIIHDYYWDFGVISQQNQALALLAQLDELNYLPANVEFQMLLSDKSLNIIENFKIDDYGVPQWHIKQERGDISMMTDIWLLKNRDNIGIDINVKKNKKIKKKSKPKRKLNSLQSTDDLLANMEDEHVKLQIIEHVESEDKKVEKSKKKKKKREKSKRKKKKKDKERKKKKKHREALLKKQIHENTTVIDDSEYIQNILEKDKLQKQTNEPKIPTSSTKILDINNNNNNDMDNLNIDDIIDEHFKEKNAKNQPIKSVKTPDKNNINQPKTSPKPINPKVKANNAQTWFKRHRSSSVGELIADKPRKKSHIKPNSFITGTSASNRPYEIIVIHQRKQPKNIINTSSTPPPRISHKRSNNRRYLNANKSANISQSSSPTIFTQHKIIRTKNGEKYKSHLQYIDNEQTDESDFTDNLLSTNQKHGNMKKPRSNSFIIESPKKQIETETKIKSEKKIKINFPKPQLSKKAKEFMNACSASITPEEEKTTQENIGNTEKSQEKVENTQKSELETPKKNEENVGNSKKSELETPENIGNTDKIVKETNQKRENDEYDTEEDTQQTTTYYQPFSGLYLAASEPAQYLDQYLPSVLTQDRCSPIINNEMNEYEYEYEEEGVHTDSETKRMRRKQRDESLKRSAMELDKRFSAPKPGMVYKPQDIGASTSQFGLDGGSDSESSGLKRTQSLGMYDIIEQDEKQSNLSTIINQKNTTPPNHETNNLSHSSNNSSNDDIIFESPIPKHQKDRYSRFMTDQFLRKKRAQSEDLSGIFDSESNYLNSPYFNQSKNKKINHSPSDSDSLNKINKINSNQSKNRRIPTAMFAHTELKQEGGAAVRDQIKNQNWHSGIEISWRTTPLPVRDNNALLLEQNFHCATCGLVLKSNFLRRARYHYCRYLGLLHCNECHKNERAVIPSHVLHELDCRPATVCCAAKTYLDQMYNIPCITLDMLSMEDRVQKNKKIKQLKKIIMELCTIKKYLDVCRDKNKLLDNIYKEYRRWIRHTGKLSLRDCVNIISFNTGDKLQILSNKLQKHIMIECDMCRGKGSYCEICNSQSVIYLFQYQQVKQCNVCKATFHIECWQNVQEDCPRCKRRQRITPPIK